MRIITVSREFASGGREVAKRLADKLGFAYYDNEIITAIAKEANLDEEYVERMIESGNHINTTLHFATSFSYISTITDSSKLLGMQYDIIKKIATRGDCIIVGRGADVILEKYKPFKLFVYASTESKIKRCKQRMPNNEIMSDKEILRQIKKIDKGRAANYAMIADTPWGNKEAYDMCINTSNVEIKEVVELLADFIEKWFESDK